MSSFLELFREEIVVKPVYILSSSFFEVLSPLLKVTSFRSIVVLSEIKDRPPRDSEFIRELLSGYSRFRCLVVSSSDFEKKLLLR